MSNVVLERERLISSSVPARPSHRPRPASAIPRVKFVESASLPRVSPSPCRPAYLSELTAEQSAAITELTSDLLLQAGGSEDEDPVEIKRTKIKLAGKLQALELLMKYHKLLTDKVEHTDGDGDNVRVLWIGEKKMSSNKDLPAAVEASYRRTRIP